MSAGPLRLRVEHGADYADRTAANVVAEIEGESEERVVVGAHYDTQLEGPGAADNATGLATLLELAHAWGSLRPLRTIVLVAFAVEELALWGSYHYVLAHAAENGATVAMVNLDALGLPFPGRRVVVADASIAAYAAAAAAAAGWQSEGELDASLHPFGDYSPFLDAGVPACWLWRFPPQHPYYHSAGDGLRTVDPTGFAEDANATAAVAYRLANDPNLALGRARPTRRYAKIKGGT